MERASFAGFASPNDEFLSLQRAESSSHDSRGLRIDGAERRNFISFCKPTSDSVRSDFCTVHPRTDLHPNTLKRYAICQRVLARFFGAARRGMITVVESKTPAGLRMIPMTGRLKNELAQWKWQTGSTSQYVFFNPHNPAKHLGHVPKTWARALKEANVSKRRLYDCRSTFCSRMYAAGVAPVLTGGRRDVEQVQRWRPIEDWRSAGVDPLKCYTSATLAFWTPGMLRLENGRNFLKFIEVGVVPAVGLVQQLRVENTELIENSSVPFGCSVPNYKKVVRKWYTGLSFAIYSPWAQNCARMIPTISREEATMGTGFTLPPIPRIPTSSDVFLKMAEGMKKLQDELGPDEELFLFIETPRGERLRVLNLSDTGARTIQAACEDENGDTILCLSEVGCLQLFCKIIKIAPGSMKRKIGFDYGGGQENSPAF
jgi:hypothetical protein